MNLRTYLTTREITQAEFAKTCGVSAGLVWQWLEGKTSVTPDKAKLIEEKTGGEVTRMEALYPDEQAA